MGGIRVTEGDTISQRAASGSIFAMLKAKLRQEQRPWLLEAQLQSYFGRVPFAIAANLLNAAILIWLLQGTVAMRWLAAWAGVLVVLSVIRFMVHRNRFRLCSSRGPQWLARYALLEGACFGASWAMAVALIMPYASPLQVAMLSMVAAGMMSGGTFTFAMVPSAARLYVALLAAGAFIGFASLEAAFAVPAVLLLTSYAFILNRSITASCRDFAERLENERELADTAKTVKILLNDYQAFGSDWLWEVDANGRMAHVSRPLADALERTEREIEGASFIDLFEDGPDMEKLSQHLAEGSPFRNLSLQLRHSGRWWKVSAGPIEEDVARGSRAMRGVAADITSSKIAEARISHMALNDALTGLPNRTSFNERIDHELARAAINDGKVALIAIDLDRFKEINDLRGHGAGDEVLRTLAQRMHAVLKEGEFLARIGGDEFSAVQSFEDQITLEDMLARLESALAEAIQLDGYDVIPGASIGVAIFPDDAQNRTSLINNADLAMYRAKGSLNHAVCFYEQSMDESVRARRALENDLRDAVANNRLTLHY